MKKNSSQIDFETTSDSLRVLIVERFARKTDRRRKSVVRTAVFFVIFVCAALLAMNAWLIYRARAADMAQISRANSNLATAVSQQIESSIVLAEHIVAGIAFELERSDVTPVTLQRLQPALVKEVSQFDGIQGLFVFDAQGRWMIHSEPSDESTQNNADRDYFIRHRTNPSASTLISAPIVSKSSGEWVIPVSRRINDPDGNFAGVVLATLRVQQLRLLLEQFQIGEQGAIALIHADQILLRRPFLEGDMGRRTTGGPFQTLFRTQRSGVAEGRSMIDGIVRIVSFEHLRNYPVLVTVAVGKDESLREWRKASILQASWVVLLCLFIAVSGRYLVQSVRQRLGVEDRLRKTRDELSEANERLGWLAQYDGLTGLPNRRYFDSRFARAFEEACVDKTSLALVMIDVDEFKKYNDLYGHIEGDECLRRVAKALSEALDRSQDFVARYGGEEMVMLLPETSGESAAGLAEKARISVLSLQIPHAGSALGIVSVSLGLAVCMPSTEDTASGLLRLADSALYRAKQAGRNRLATSLE